MKAILDDLNAVAGVTGAFVCDEAGKVVEASMQQPLPSETLASVGRTVAQAGDGISLKGQGQDLELVFDSGVIVVKAVDGGFLCIVCSQRVNIPMLNLAANMAVRQLRRQIQSAGANALQAAAVIDGPTVDAGKMAAVEHELAIAVGPVAALIVDDALNALHASRQTLRTSQVAALLDQLQAGIDDPAKRQTFRKSADAILKG